MRDGSHIPASEFSRLEMSRLETAIQLALAAHRGQIDEDDQPHIVHSLEVMFKLKSQLELPGLIPEGYTVEDMLIAAVLHDVPEDTTTTLDDIRRDFGGLIADAVDGVTRRVGIEGNFPLSRFGIKETYRDFIYRAAETPASKLLKRTDLLVNLCRCHKISPKKAKWRDKLEYKYTIALRVLDSPEPTTWEKVSWELSTTKVDGVWGSKFYMADPNGKKIEVTSAEVDAVR